MKICEEKIPPLLVFQEITENNKLFADGICWLNQDLSE